MSDVQSCKGGTVRTESKDLAPHHTPMNPLNLLNPPNLFRTQSKGGTPHGLTLNPSFTKELFMSETKRAYFTYMVRCADGTLYTGFTVDDVHRRIAMHNAGKGAKYTKSRRPVELVWYHEWESEHEARSAEYHTKKLSRREKEELVKEFGD